MPRIIIDVEEGQPGGSIQIFGGEWYKLETFQFERTRVVREKFGPLGTVVEHEATGEEGIKIEGTFRVKPEGW